MTSRKLVARGTWFLAMGATWLVLQAPVRAQIEDIGPISIVEGQPVEFVFDNQVLPDPSFKVLDFLGEAFNDTSEPVTLSFQYGYEDLSGLIELVAPGSSEIVVPAGGPHTLDPEPVQILEFCPPTVSLHIEADGPVSVQGQFSHICIPEPSAASLLLAGSGLCFVPRRRRR